MKIKATFIMTFILLVTHSVVAQEDFFVKAGAESDFSVAYQAGSDYTWEVLTHFSPDTLAYSSDYLFVSDSNSNSIRIKWNNPGLYFLKVTEIDSLGCTNAKASSINVTSELLTIGFEQLESSSCFSSTGNGTDLPLKILNAEGEQLDSLYFPIKTQFLVNGEKYYRHVYYDEQFLRINDEQITVNSFTGSDNSIRLVSATTKNNLPIITDSLRNIHKYSVLPVPVIEFISYDMQVVQGDSLIHRVKLSSDEMTGSIYSWWIDPDYGTSTDLAIHKQDTASIQWDGQTGLYSINVQVTDVNGCLSDTIQQQIEIIEKTEPPELTVNAGNDTITGFCNPFTLKAYVSDTTGISFLWEPADNLDDSTSATPTFNPGESTLFTVKVRNNTGETKKDSIYVEVAQLVAEAGDEVHKDSLTSIVLDGSESFGEGISYYWSTDSGKIEKGENSPNPTVSGFGVYYLELTDVYGCTAIDSVTVTSINNPPVNVDPPLSPPLATDDYDTTAFRTEVKIAVLTNDSDPDDDIDVFSLSITDLPVNGTAYVDYNDFTIRYVPENSFAGTDYFEYQICDTSQKCANAIVYVNVLEGEFLIPDAFSPNGDNINDYFEIIGIEKYQNNSIVIFNRWGKKVYEAVNYGISSDPKFWDGKFSTGLRKRDTELPTGTYYYVLKLGNGKKPVAGTIYLDR